MCPKNTPDTDWQRIYAWPNLLDAYRKAAKGKRRTNTIARFEFNAADYLLELQQQLIDERYQPGDYNHFHIHQPKHRLISAAPFRDRIIHHALCNVIEPPWERAFIRDSFANRRHLGNHAAVNRLHYFSKRYRYVLRLDIVKHFANIDHQILSRTLSSKITDPRVMGLIERVLDSGRTIPNQDPDLYFYPHDDLLSLSRPKGLPIGNLTSQFWSNCYMHPFDLFVKRELRCKAYCRYVDDFALFSNHKAELWQWKQAIHRRLDRLRLRFHAHSAEVATTQQGTPWLGFVVFPSHRKLKRRKVVYANQRLDARFRAWQRGRISFAEFDASVQGWVNHCRHADSWGLRRHILGQYRW